jgi:hypothetical protein
MKKKKLGMVPLAQKLSALWPALEEFHRKISHYQAAEFHRAVYSYDLQTLALFPRRLGQWTTA